MSGLKSGGTGAGQSRPKSEAKAPVWTKSGAMGANFSPLGTTKSASSRHFAPAAPDFARCQALIANFGRDFSPTLPANFGASLVTPRSTSNRDRPQEADPPGVTAGVWQVRPLWCLRGSPGADGQLLPRQALLLVELRLALLRPRPQLVDSRVERIVGGVAVQCAAPRLGAGGSKGTRRTIDPDCELES